MVLDQSLFFDINIYVLLLDLKINITICLFYAKGTGILFQYWGKTILFIFLPYSSMNNW